MSRVIDNTDYRDATPVEQTEIEKKRWGGVCAKYNHS